MRNPNRVVWEGWTVRNFIEDFEWQLDMIMRGESFIQPFKTKKELVAHIKDNQPYYKKSIPEVNEYFAKRYNLK